MQVKQISDIEIYLLTKYIKNILWRVAKRLSYIEDARCLNFKMGLQEVGCGGMARIDLGEKRDRWRALVNALMNHRIP